MKDCKRFRVYENTSTSSQMTDKYHNTNPIDLAFSYEPEIPTKNPLLSLSVLCYSDVEKKIIN